MLLGYNHNINYKDSVFHIQTEDSGIKNPHIITLLYREGVILCSKKTSYADILKIESLEAVVEDLMKEQHKDMLRRLKSGEFDAKAFGGTQQTEPVVELQEEASVSIAPHTPDSAPDNTGIGLLFQETVITDSSQSGNRPQNEETPIKKQDATSLDDAILNFFGASK
jgi:hypothetical protein